MSRNLTNLPLLCGMYTVLERSASWIRGLVIDLHDAAIAPTPPETTTGIEIVVPIPIPAAPASATPPSGARPLEMID